MEETEIKEARMRLIEAKEKFQQIRILMASVEMSINNADRVLRRLQ